MSEKKKRSAALVRAQNRYMEQFKVARVRLTHDQFETIKAHSESTGESMNGFFVRAAQETMERDNANKGG